MPPEVTVKVGSPEEIYSVDGVEILDGIVVDRKGRIFFSQGENIMILGENGAAKVWAILKKPLGHKIRRDGVHVVCDAGEKAVYFLDENGRIEGKISEAEEYGSLGSPNDVCVDEKSGGIYFTVPNEWDYVEPSGELFYSDREGRTTLVADRLPYCNGIVLDEENQMLYVSSSTRSRIDSFKVESPGKLLARELFCTLPQKEKGNTRQSPFAPDGMCMSSEGLIFIAHYGKGELQVIDRSGSLLESIGAFIPKVTNVCLNKNTLYMSGGGISAKGLKGSILRVNLQIEN